MKTWSLLGIKNTRELAKKAVQDSTSVPEDCRNLICGFVDQIDAKHSLVQIHAQCHVVNDKIVFQADVSPL